jgi:hypothetical protein
MFEYEHTSKYNVSETRELLIKEIEGDEFHLSPIQGKTMLNDIETIINKLQGKSLNEIKNEIKNNSIAIDDNVLNEMFAELKAFICTEPQMPAVDKKFSTTGRISISPCDSREKIMENIYKNTSNSEMALLALYVYRDMERIEWKPFVKAAIERNPVCFTDLAGKDENEIYSILAAMPDESIYDGKRLALPDEVWNFKRGDGIEKAFLMADFILNNNDNQQVKITINNNRAALEYNGKGFTFASSKGINKIIEINGNQISVN